MNSEDYIRRTFALALQGSGRTFPNPLVGAVIVKDDRIISEGFHHQRGMAHAELDAIQNAKESLEGATIYVNLEPCCHTNKLTPPCAQRLIQEKFKKVVICNLDPNPNVFGKGVALLREHGIEVEHGILSEEGEELNEVFFHAQRTKLPFVHLKLATTLDGRIALPSGESQWITGEKAREYVHVLRSQSQAVIVGAETFRKDHPQLNVRLKDYKGPQPLRVVFTKSGNLAITPDERTLVYSQTKKENFIFVPDIRSALEDLFKRGIISVFLEGGADLATNFMKEGLVNRVSLFMNPSFLGSGPSALSDLGLAKLHQRPHLNHVKVKMIESDLYLTGRL